MRAFLPPIPEQLGEPASELFRDPQNVEQVTSDFIGARLDKMGEGLDMPTQLALDHAGVTYPHYRIGLGSVTREEVEAAFTSIDEALPEHQAAEMSRRVIGLCENALRSLIGRQLN